MQSPKALSKLIKFFLLLLVGTVALCIFSIVIQHNPENATLAELRDAGSIKVVIQHHHHGKSHNPSTECPHRIFIGTIPKIRGISANLTVSQILDGDIVKEKSKPWAWHKDTELRNGRPVIQSIGIKGLTPGSYRAQLTVEKNGEQITVSSEVILTIPIHSSRDSSAPKSFGAFFLLKN